MWQTFRVLAALVVLAASSERLTLAARQQATALSEDYLFPSGTGLLLFHVHRDKTAEFEAVVTRLIDALNKAGDEPRRLQAANWRIFKSSEVPREGTVYLFFFDPALPGVEYNPIKVLSEAVPAEVQKLYEQMRAATIRVERMGLTKLR